MNYLLLTLTLVFCYIVQYLFKFYKTKSTYAKYGIPFKEPYPVIGNFIEVVLRRKTCFMIWNELYNLSPEAKYMVAFNFKEPIIMIRDLELIKSIAIKNTDSFVDHKSIVEIEHDEFFGNNLFNMKGTKWHTVRATLTPEFSSSKMKIMFDIMSENAKNFTDVILKMVESGKKEFEMKDVLSKYGNDVIASTSFGININSMKDPKNEFYILGQKFLNWNGILSLKFLLTRNFPWLMKILRIKIFGGPVENFFTNFIKETIQVRDEKKISRPDMIDLMMSTRGTPSELSLKEMTGLAFGNFLSGFETVVTQTCFLAHELAVNPKIRLKLRQEIDSTWLETKGNLTYYVLNKMPYMDAVVNECLRFYSVSGMTNRMCTKSFTLPPVLPGKSEFTLHPKDIVWIPIGAILNDSRYFKNPEKFDPERFFRSKYILNQPPFLPFGLGPRMCIGTRFALLQMKILIFHLLRRCDLEICSRTNVPMKFSTKAQVPASDGGWWLEIGKRNDSSVLRASF